ncbi:MAG: hypothetical protein KKH22_00790 [Proteobacteria bacterium]|nr:hypothetical protein [Pseudomonadota bacterium]
MPLPVDPDSQANTTCSKKYFVTATDFQFSDHPRSENHLAFALSSGCGNQTEMTLFLSGKDFDEVFTIWYFCPLAHRRGHAYIYPTLAVCRSFAPHNLFSETPSAFSRDYKADLGFSTILKNEDAPCLLNRKI